MEIPPQVVAVITGVFPAVLGVAFVIWWRWRVARVQEVDVRLDSVPREGVFVPLLASFHGVRSVPLGAIASNNTSPMLRIFEDRIAYRVLRTRERPLSDIAYADVTKWWGSHGILLAFVGSRWTFIGTTSNREALRNVLRYLASRGVPLAERAQAFCADGGVAGGRGVW